MLQVPLPTWAEHAMISGDARSATSARFEAPMRWGIEGVSASDEVFVLPVGTVTFLLTDVAGSTRLWSSEPDDVMRAAIVRHYEILTAAVDAHDGVRPQEQGEGDSIVAAFARPTDALAAAAVAQAALAAEAWMTSESLRVRMAIHTGEAHLRDDANYAGQAIIRAARLRNIGHGGQVLVSGTTRDLAVDQSADRFEFRSLGDRQLRDLERPEHVWQLVVPGLDDQFGELVGVESVQNSLPVSLSPFIGRGPAIVELTALVRAERLVTVTGTGGAGKTRLAQQVGAELLGDFPRGVWWVDLAPLDAGGVESAVRAAFGISEAAQTTLDEAVRRLLGDGQCLLIVDNCEHLTAVVAELVDRLLRQAPTLRVLATSRVMLDVPGEHAWRVPPMALPDRSAQPSIESLSGCESVRLFCDRARRARPNFELTASNGPEVSEICHRLGGIPLAIELAAARTRMLDPRRILAGLDDAFRLLSGGSKAVLPRQQTLDASIAWSYNLLSVTEQALLRRLSVFVDGWTLDAAEAVCPDPDDSVLADLDVFDALDRLVDHSLVSATDTRFGPRFTFLETVRQYAARQLAMDPAERSSAIDRHATHFTDWMVSLGGDLAGEGFEQSEGSLVSDQANVAAALAYEATIDPDRAGDALWALHPVLPHLAWSSYGLLATIDRLDTSISPERRWKALFARSAVLDHVGHAEAAIATSAAMNDAAAEVDDPVGMALARLLTLGYEASLGAAIDADAWQAPIAVLADRAPEYAASWWGGFALFAAQHGRIDLADVAIAAMGDDRAHPAGLGARLVGEGYVSFFRGETVRAVEVLQRAIEAPFVSPNTRGAAAGALMQSAADLGLDLAGDLEPTMRFACEVEGNRIAGIAADNVLAISSLVRGETDEAAARYAAMLEALPGVLGTIYFVHEIYVLVAAGYDAFEDYLITQGDPMVTACIHRCRAEQHLRRGDIVGALNEAHHALRIERVEGLDRCQMFTLECIARVLGAAGRNDEAARILGACRTARAKHHHVRMPSLQSLIDAAEDRDRHVLGDDAHAAATADGATLDLEAATIYATRLRVPRNAASAGWEALTPAEARVAELVAESLTNSEVARELLMGVETVKTHLSRVFAKVGVANRKELIVAASRRAAEGHR